MREISNYVYFSDVKLNVNGNLYLLLHWTVRHHNVINLSHLSKGHMLQIWRECDRLLAPMRIWLGHCAQYFNFIWFLLMILFSLRISIKGRTKYIYLRQIDWPSVPYHVRDTEKSTLYANELLQMSKIFKSLFSEEERTVQFKTRTEGRKKWPNSSGNIHYRTHVYIFRVHL